MSGGITGLSAKIRFVAHADRVTFAHAVADAVTHRISAAITEHGQALILVPGGATPRAALADLAMRDLDWKRVTLAPGDERFVPPADPLSNAGMLSGIFGQLPVRILNLVNGTEKDAEQAAQQANERLRTLNWPADLTWLGMGEDGHVASLFPGKPPPPTHDAPFAFDVLPDPLPREAPVARVTLNAQTLCAARAMILAITGASKRRLVEEAVAGGPATALPVGQLLAHAARLPFVIHWAP